MYAYVWDCFELKRNAVFWDILRYLETHIVQAATKANLLLRSFEVNAHIFEIVWDLTSEQWIVIAQEQLVFPFLHECQEYDDMIHPSGTQHKTQKY